MVAAKIPEQASQSTLSVAAGAPHIRAHPSQRVFLSPCSPLGGAGQL